MNESQIAVVFAALAILATAGLLFRQGALGGKALAALSAATLGIAAFLFVTLTAP